jgi:hypothetical protein
MESDSQKLDFLVRTLAEVKTSQAAMEKTCESFEILVKRVSVLESVVAEQSNTITHLQEEIKHLKDRDNMREQEKRDLSLRLFNLPGSDSETGLASKVYEVLKPILTAAKANGDLPTLPQVGTTIEQVYRVGKFAAGVDKPPPPIVVKFSSEAIRMAVLKHKRINTPPIDGPKKLILTEDLTKPTHRKMKELLGDERVSKVWSRSGVLWFVKVGSKQPVIVNSVFDSNDAILK